MSAGKTGREPGRYCTQDLQMEAPLKSKLISFFEFNLILLDIFNNLAHSDRRRRLLQHDTRCDKHYNGIRDGMVLHEWDKSARGMQIWEFKN